ncbi:glycosyltransferase family 2 protein [Paenibacillus radicis (ex Xue et al. 2023)]|uniref:Glycosyltransferase family 2 protein n=1 Tax=Paenibacillus radicis (ex Xue et al. 2023) TaxID=2972489 RepID=A0ABT1YSC5_9BACL|nr:glycosyltransferase family 2 protein [Paenibacillus radicis (ex Xue et al. 2023)]MCR8636076.1 glycosyltransferase family 2 protein [Paenibacillus radicis (ex Xue et al. 2023)]
MTVVVPTYNKQKFIAQTLASIGRQTFQDWQILMIDDASTDNTLHQAKQYADPDRTRIVELQENKGICHVLNHALEYIDTKYFVQVDGDDWLEPDTLRALYEAMEKESETTALAYANSAQWNHGNNVDHFGSIRQHHLFRNRYDFATYPRMVQPRFYRTKCVREVGGWETDDLTQGRMLEDRRILLRLLDQYEYAFVNRILYHFRTYEDNLSADKNAAQYNQVIQYFTDKALERWGGKFKAQYKGPIDSWQKVVLAPTNLE